jgi:hypothetical protein
MQIPAGDPLDILTNAQNNNTILITYNQFSLISNPGNTLKGTVQRDLKKGKKLHQRIDM